MAFAEPSALGVPAKVSGALDASTERIPLPVEFVNSEHVPLAVDLDGTLIKTDLLWESLLALLKRNFFLLFLTPVWLLKGRAYLKQEIARRIALDVTALPYNEEFLNFLREEHGRGRMLVLTTAADRVLAQNIADYLAIFAEVLASNGKQNLKRTAKRKALQDKFGNRGFDYAGNADDDLEVWAYSNAAVVVNAPTRVIRQTETIGRVTGVFAKTGNAPGALIRALRIKHWIKNLLIFVPLITSQELEKFDLILQAIYAFAAFSLIASSVYVFNDLCDLSNDRQHHEKRKRPFAAGELSLATGLVLVPLLLFIAILISLLLPLGFLSVSAGYFVLNLVYSLYLKKILLLDVISLAIFYTLRVVAGGLATGVIASNWLLVFSVFIFLSLAFAKRVSELHFLRDSHKEKTQGRGYISTDLEQLAYFGAASGYISVMVFALYVNSPNAKQVYTSSSMLWIVCPLLLYWISRLWLMVHRRQIPEDPIVFVFNDKVSWLVGLLVGIVLIVAGLI